MTSMTAIAATRSRKRDRRLALGRTHLPRAHAALHRRADDLDAADLDQVRLCGHAVPAAMVAERTDAGELPEAARSDRTASGQDFLRFFWNSLFVSTTDDDPRGHRRGAGGLRFLALRLSRAQIPLLRRAAAQHVPGGDLPRAALHPDAAARAGEHSWLADPHLSDVRPAARDLAAQGLLRQHSLSSSSRRRASTAPRGSRRSS